MEGSRIPAAAIALAIVSGAALLFAGVGFALSMALVGVWILSFWLVPLPPPEPRTKRVEALQISRSGMRDLIEHSGLPLLLLDNNRIIMANANAREAVGKHILGQDARVALRHPAAVDLLSRKGGGSITVQGLTGPKSNWQMTIQQIDERYSLVELINRTSEADVSQAHTDFVANASHELRTPLASIIGYMETLEDEAEDIPPKQARKFYATVLREARRLQTLVDDLMSLSRVEAEKHDQPREPLKIAPIIRQSSRDGAGLERFDRVALSIEEDDLRVRGDSRQLEQLVRNLVDNALKYGGAEEQVDVSLTRGERDMAILTVRDHGEGIAPEHLPHLTRRFYRTDPGRSRAAGGTGLGLAICKHIVERHRGRLDIDSKQGDGTTVTVRLPLMQDAA
ncbi:sensor histidine kinase [Aurantiacibacter rhizosphaerae]|uniref:histidine kinase n=1 Tax=Aurantiacibacter rhizosphaerae TaxID=2691582 RepID=A0A844XEE2_9SPHN|nr:ATP-binding protein [Aurantiacibacter rhizosphaerae]MWV28129.1 two-component sensor histidine kinase [Aurantiacibacter rhizosphaerae]